MITYLREGRIKTYLELLFSNFIFLLAGNLHPPCFFKETVCNGGGQGRRLSPILSGSPLLLLCRPTKPGNTAWKTFYWGLVKSGSTVSKLLNNIMFSCPFLTTYICLFKCPEVFLLCQPVTMIKCA